MLKQRAIDSILAVQMQICFQVSDEVKFEFLEGSLFIVGYIVSYVRIT